MNTMIQTAYQLLHTLHVRSYNNGVLCIGYCIQDRSSRWVLDPHEKPRCIRFGCSIIWTKVFMQRLNSKGDDGSPCKTPLWAFIGTVQESLTPTVMYNLLYMSVKIRMRLSSTWWYCSAYLMRLCWTNANAFLRSSSVTHFFAHALPISVYEPEALCVLIPRQFLMWNPFEQAFSNICFQQGSRLVSSNIPMKIVWTTLVEEW